MTAVVLTNNRYIGKVCPKHPELGGLRLKSGGKCLGCKRERERDKHVKYPSAKAYRKRWQTENRDKEAERVRKWRKANPAQALKVVQNWRLKNPGGFLDINARRRSAKLQRTVAWADLEAIKAIYKEAARTGMSVDHIIPLQGEFVSGLHVEYNLQLLTSSENASKCNKFTPYTEAEREVNAL